LPPLNEIASSLSLFAMTAARTWRNAARNAISPGMRVLYHLPLSPYSRKVRLALAEKRLPADLRAEKVWERRPEYLELNPAGTVPTLVEDNGLATRAGYCPVTLLRFELTVMPVSFRVRKGVNR
jgi:hypothetical protein